MLIKAFLDLALTSQKQLSNLIERVELTERKEIIIKFCSYDLEAIA